MSWLIVSLIGFVWVLLGIVPFTILWRKDFREWPDVFVLLMAALAGPIGIIVCVLIILENKLRRRGHRHENSPESC